MNLVNNRLRKSKNINSEKINTDMVNEDYDATKQKSEKWFYTLFDKRLWILIVDILNISVKVYA